MLPGRVTDKAFANAELLPAPINADPATGGTYQFPEAASFGIGFSSVRPDAARRRGAFSASNSFDRLAGIWLSTTSNARIRALTDARPMRPLRKIGNDDGCMTVAVDFIVALVGLRSPAAATKPAAPRSANPGRNPLKIRRQLSK